MKKVISLFALVCSTVASAAPCLTSSHGIYFYDGSYNASYTQGVISRCQMSQFTSNQECNSNLNCYSATNPYPSGQIACTTSSRSLQYQAVASDVDVAYGNVVRHCQAGSFTSNQECSSNIACADASQVALLPSMVRCMTSSNTRGGMLPFAVANSDINVAASQAVSACQSNQFTSNQECTSNLSCQYIYAAPPAPVPPVYVPAPVPPVYIPAPVPPVYGPGPGHGPEHGGPGYGPGHGGPGYGPGPGPIAAPIPAPSYGRGAWRCTIATSAGEFPGFGMDQGQGIMGARQACVNAGVEQGICMHGGATCRRVE